MTCGSEETVKKEQLTHLACAASPVIQTPFCIRREWVVAKVKDGLAIQAIVQQKQPTELSHGCRPGSVIGSDCCGIRRDIEALVRPCSRIMPEFQI
jgi:hypothetical protein